MNASVVPYLCSCCRRQVGDVLSGFNRLYPCARCQSSVCSNCFRKEHSLCFRCLLEVNPEAAHKRRWWRPFETTRLPEKTLLPSDPYKYLGKRVTVLVDRPLGAAHPKHGHIYPINYGYIFGTLADDGEPMDAYILGVEQPVRHFKGIAIAFLERAEEDDPKLIVVPKGQNFTDEEILAATHFQEQFFTVTVRRGQS